MTFKETNNMNNSQCFYSVNRQASYFICFENVLPAVIFTNSAKTIMG